MTDMDMENQDDYLTIAYMLGLHDGKKQASANSHCPDLAGSAPVARVYRRVKAEAMKCKDGSHAKETLRWVLELIREEQNTEESRESSS